MLPSKPTALCCYPPGSRDALPHGGLRHWISSQTFSSLQPCHDGTKSPWKHLPQVFSTTKLLLVAISAEFYVHRMNCALWTQDKPSDYPCTSTMTFTLIQTSVLFLILRLLTQEQPNWSQAPVGKTSVHCPPPCLPLLIALVERRPAPGPTSTPSATKPCLVAQVRARHWQA